MNTDFRTRFLALASDGKPRTVSRIRRELGLPETANPGESIRNLQMALAAEGSGLRIRCTVLREEAHRRLWWVEERKVSTSEKKDC